MAKNDWDNIVEEKVSDELRHKTMVRVRQELDSLSSPQFSWNWLWAAVPGLAALIFFYNRIDRQEGPGPIAQNEDDFLKELGTLSSKELESLDEEMIAELDFYKDLDVLEDWDGREES